MSEQTLRQIDEENTKNIASLKEASRLKSVADGKPTYKDADIIKADANPGDYAPYTGARMRYENGLKAEQTAQATQGIADATERGSTLFREHGDELRELALIEAHLGGVAINVEQPLEIGQKIDVHTPHQ